MIRTLLQFDINDYMIPALPNDDVPTRKCRAVICDVCVVETDPEEGLGNIDVAFLLLSPSFAEPYIFEKHFTNWSVEGGIEAAFHCLVPEDMAECFEDLIGTVFDAEIYYRAYDNKFCADLELNNMITPPPIKRD